MGEETSRVRGSSAIRFALQWSLSNMGEETNGSRPAIESTAVPSMEPLQHGRGNSRVVAGERVVRADLQWSLSNMGEETPTGRGS